MGFPPDASSDTLTRLVADKLAQAAIADVRQPDVRQKPSRAAFR